jgi:broad specificity phosphatase PhoE
MRTLLLTIGHVLLLQASACGPRDAKPAASSAAPACVHGRAVVVVRHAEKASADKDTPLSERGQERARVLAAMLGRTGVTRLFATQYRRTRDTLAPLAERLSLPVEVRDASTPAAALAEELRALPDGSVAVFATHSNVLPAMVKALAGVKPRGVEGDSLPDDEFSRVVVITEPCNGSPQIVELGSGD